MIQKGVLVGTAAALVLGVAFVAAAVVSRPHQSEALPTPASKMKVTLVAPKEPAVATTGGKLETVPDGAPDAETGAAVPAPPAPPRPTARAEPPPPHSAWSPSARREPEPADDDFPDEREEAFVRRDYAEPYRERRERWRERRYDEDRWEMERDRDDRFEPIDPEPPPWWRR